MPSTTYTVGGCENVQFGLFDLRSIPNLAFLAFVNITIVLAVGIGRNRT